MNRFTGPIPTAIGERLPNLQVFGCKHCNLTGVIPDSMTKLQLRGLFLNANQLTHMPMDFRMPSCINPDGTVSRDCCDLRWNQWRCPIPAWMQRGHPAGGSDHQCNGAANCTA